MEHTYNLLSLTSHIFSIKWQNEDCTIISNASDNTRQILLTGSELPDDITTLIVDQQIIKQRQQLIQKNKANVIHIPVYGVKYLNQPTTFLREEIIIQPSDHAISFFTDVTELVKQREITKKSQQRLALVLEGTRLGMWDWNPQTNEVTFDDRWAEMLGLKLADLTQTLADWQDRVHPEDIEDCFADITAHIDGKTSFYENLHRMRHSDGEWRYILDRGKVVEKDDHGKPIRFTGTHTDVTALKMAELQAKSALSARSRFFANMSHELRTPLHGILNLAEFGLAETHCDEKDQALKSILSSTNILANIVNDVLDFSKIEAGKLEIEHIEFELANVITSVIKPLSQIAQSKGVNLVSHIDDQVAKVLKGDPVRVIQILNNLCANALKFTDKGSVQLSVNVLETTDTCQHIQFEVIDTGIGIDTKIQPNLFKAFHQADASTSRKYGGTGLGLSICVKLSEMMAGKLDFISEKGQGTTFTYQQKFTVSGLSEIAKTHHETVNLQQANILIAEDNRVNQTIVTKMLSAHNVNATVVENGQECIDYCRENIVDLIFMDIQMPVMDGIEATKLLRSSKASSHIPIIAMTANTMKEDIEQYLAIGMNGYITKPFNRAKLNSLLTIYAPQHEHPGINNLAVRISDPTINNEEKLQTICQALKQLIPQANRISLWIFNQEYTQIQCLQCLDHNNEYSNGLVLKAADFPRYFKYILKNEVLDASHARENPVTKCFNESYFEPFKIFSLLDYIFSIDEKPLGVICCENVGSQVNWTESDKSALITVANITTLFFSRDIIG
ncbi:ATP-binding protein [Thalassotalea sp. 1_MG-2023]|uniref:response regulator n=1 Tax=Thalassotalea sp. 1_MG-2023 TaxID=3062680 RepID=UPI0026E3FAEA|nr:PAS domain-containing hybrid sensor histidine kinase/response regulator [Thalassotalea sp. 1_MG-2023]MDO6426654.1 ATP-binding protein [Thalassotalea sp. 1_MG-2023]